MYSIANIRSVAATVSTNDDVSRLAREGEPEGLWLRADHQSGGRGRHNRHWQSPPGNVHASTIVRVRPGDPPPATLAFVAAVALDQLVAAHAGADRVRLKWPNDVMIDGAKVAGILLERVDDAVVVGFGVNLAHHPADLDRPTTSLMAAGAGMIEPEDFLVDLAAAMAAWLARWRGEGFAALRTRWLERAHPGGTPLAVAGGGASAFEGLFDGLEEDGALRLRLADGRIRIIHAGDILQIPDG